MMSALDRPDKLAFTLAEVADLTGLSRRSIADGCRAGRIPHRKYGQQRVMTRADLDQFLAQLRVESAAGDAGEASEIERFRAKVATRLARKQRRAA